MAKLSNMQIEEIAIKYIQKLEPSLKRAKKGSGYDLESKDKIVEVKATKSNLLTQRIFFSSQAESDALKNSKNKYFLYRVINVGKSNISLKKYVAEDLELIHEPRWRVKIRKVPQSQ
jgi:hypothetical protein